MKTGLPRGNATGFVSPLPLRYWPILCDCLLDICGPVGSFSNYCPKIIYVASSVNTRAAEIVRIIKNKIKNRKFKNTLTGVWFVSVYLLVRDIFLCVGNARNALGDRVVNG